MAASITILLAATGCARPARCVECGLNREQSRAEEAPADETISCTAREPGTIPGAREDPGSDPPTPAPEPGPEGCVASEAVGPYEVTLKADAIRRLEHGIVSQGYCLLSREGRFVRNRQGAHVGTEFTLQGKRFAVVTMMALTNDPGAIHFATNAAGEVHMVHDRPRNHRIELRVCGVNPCVMGQGARIHILPRSY